MTSTWIYVFALASVVAALPVDDVRNKTLRTLQGSDLSARNNVIESALLDAIEELRNLILNGDPENGIPVLDPFQLEHISVDDQTIPVPGARLAIDDLTVTNLSTFVINNLSVSTASVILQRYNIEVDAEIPVLNIDAEKYDLLINVFGLQVFGIGPAKLALMQPRVKINLLVNLRLGLLAIYANIMECRVEISLTDLKSEINGLLEDPAVDDFVNLFLRNLVLEMLDVFAEDLTNEVSPIVQNIANDILADINLIDLIG